MAAVSTMPSPDRLSNLPDDILIHILSLVPVCEAASTTALSRRWRRPLWLDTAVNLNHRSAGHGPRKVALLIRDFALHPAGKEEEDTAGVQSEPLIEGLEYGGAIHCIHAAPSPPRLPYYDLSIVKLTFLALRVLQLAGCNLLMYGDDQRPPWSPYDDDDADDYVEEEDLSGIVFPCLEVLRLRQCRTDSHTLQTMLSAAPRLADLRLEAVTFLGYKLHYDLRCPTATVIAIANCSSADHSGQFTMVVDAPSLRRFSYSQVTHPSHGTMLSFERPPPAHLEHVHLELHSDPWSSAALRLSVLHELSYVHVRVLRLTAYSLADLAHDLLPVFDNLKRLEVEELYGCVLLNQATAANAVLNLLSHCPAIHELRLRFRWREYMAEPSDHVDMDATIAELTPCRSMYEMEDDNGACCEGLDLDGRIYGHYQLDCLNGSLRRVVVEFDTEELTCFQVWLVRYLVSNAVVLEEVIVDGGKEYDSSRIDQKIENWRHRRTQSTRLKETLSLDTP